MTQETQKPQLNIPVVSGSALIANFMYPNAKAEYESGEIEIEDGIYKKATLIFGNFDLMKYHSSWDWLMPVYRKIRDIINERSKYDKHTRTNYDLLELDVQMAICEVNIEKAFDSTVKFIECWNARKTPEFDKIILDELNGAESDCNIEEENYSPYCELCGGCGEDGCCSHLSCFRTLIENPKCEYGKTYLRDAQFADELYKLGFEIKEKLKNKEITADEAVIEYENNYDLIWKKVYGRN